MKHPDDEHALKAKQASCSHVCELIAGGRFRYRCVRCGKLFRILTGVLKPEGLHGDLRHRDKPWLFSEVNPPRSRARQQE